MQIARSLDTVNAETTPSVVSVGNFDGVHCGHQMVLASMVARARKLSATSGKPVRSVVVTFDPHPAHVLHTTRRTPLLTPLPEKLDLLAATGLDLALVLPFTEDLRRWSPHDFCRRVLCDALHTAEVHEGETFRFGYGAEADVASLSQLGEEFCFKVHAYEPRILRGAPISSSRIRALLAAGQVSQARALLGRSFAVRSTPAPGRGYGSRYTVPTINLAPYAEILPANGVYITTLCIGSDPDSRLFRGVTNVGNRPTFGADSFAVETHLLNFEPIALDEATPLTLTFLHRLRDEHRFPTPEALRAQIARDVAKAQRFFTLSDALHIPLT
ncbi:MAG TPA: bifunctional riboflavin kinase/FMN adenylyltransferase [Acidobacteriaceae bacterium]|jgi:riboflavin kinase/FMN adenylyltransferase|nr:bifunctional riboflavin kinase/FMN adenylyltransferase [Acidobacteriaceae bacterium]